VPADKPLEALLKDKAAELGFAATGVARADAAPRSGERLRQWLDEGRHGGMIWMEERAHHRAASPSTRKVATITTWSSER
jgi:epoxyqueuosine reductase